MIRIGFATIAAVLLAGCASPEHSTGLDTGNIDPGASATLTFDRAGQYVIHCHPHPWMEQIVTVVEGGNTTASVTIHDAEGDDTAYRFEPARLEVGPGAVVTYENAGRFAHTATEFMESH